MAFLYRIAPAVLLFFFAPLVAEFVLGDLTFAQFGALFALAPLYGGGAILIRETVRRTRRGWPTFLLLGFAYALLEEGLLTQSLFNPNYLHLRLIDYGFVPGLGIAVPWTIFVLSIHVAWSLAVPIGIVEAMAPSRRSEPWLKLPGIFVSAILFVAGALLVLRFSLSQTSFRASPLQISISVLLILVGSSAAFIVSRGKKTPDANGKPHPILLGVGSFLGGSAFQIANSFGRERLPWPVTVSLELVIGALIISFFAWASRSKLWTAIDGWSAATGGLLCYAWLGYTVDRALHGPGHALEHTVFVAAAVLITGWAGLKAARFHAGRKDAAPLTAPKPVPIS